MQVFWPDEEKADEGLFRLLGEDFKGSVEGLSLLDRVVFGLFGRSLGRNIKVEPTKMAWNAKNTQTILN